MRLIKTIALFIFPLSLVAQGNISRKRIQEKLDSFRAAGNFPGMVIGIRLADNTPMAFASGYADTAKKIKITTADYLMQGSVGKTYVAAIAFQLYKEGKLDVDAKITKYLGDETWFQRLPNANDITVKMLMRHTSGIMRYEFKDAFTKELTNQPGKTWQPVELLSYIFDEKPTFAAGKGWDYADTNYIILGMIIEKISGKKYYDLLRERILDPLALHQTRPTNKRKLPGLVQGYAGDDNPFGKKSSVIDEEGNFIINPQFEWTGGGIYSTTADLAKWCKLLYEGKAFDSTLLPLMLDTVAAEELGPHTGYGMGVIVHASQRLGTFYGHSGFFPGYLAEMYYFPKYKTAIALQTNSSDFKTLKIYDLKILVEIARLIFSGSEN
jgi:D-alanyl-D-alanine carboxypeptidase